VVLLKLLHSEDCKGKQQGNGSLEKIACLKWYHWMPWYHNFCVMGLLREVKQILVTAPDVIER